MKFTFNIEDNECMELIDQVTRNTLKNTYEQLQEPTIIPFFSVDPKEEAKKLKKYLKALKLVHNWYAVQEDHL